MKHPSQRIRALVVTCAIAGLAVPALARDWWREPAFPPEPISVIDGPHRVDQLTFGAGSNPQEIRSLPVIDNATGTSCRGWIRRDPTYSFELSVAHDLLRVRVEPLNAATTPVLVVRAPDDIWRCHDGNRGRQATEIDVLDATPGVYEVWAGSLDGTDHHEMNVVIESIDLESD